MQITQIVHCPDCGKMAQRHFRLQANISTDSAPADTSQVIARTECSACDYLLDICVTTGQVIESYVPSVRSSQPLTPPPGAQILSEEQQWTPIRPLPA